MLVFATAISFRDATSQKVLFLFSCMSCQHVVSLNNRTPGCVFSCQLKFLCCSFSTFQIAFYCFSFWISYELMIVVILFADPVTAAEMANKEEVDSRSVFVGNVRIMLSQLSFYVVVYINLRMCSHHFFLRKRNNIRASIAKRWGCSPTTMSEEVLLNRLCLSLSVKVCRPW